MNKKLYTENQISFHKNINPDLSFCERPIIEKSSKSISGLPAMILGSLPAEGGGLIFEEHEKEEIVYNYPHISHFFRKFIGSGELIKGYIRYCLWLTKDDFLIARNIPILQKRFEIVRNYREQSAKKQTRDLALTPYLFAERRFYARRALIIPITTSERRPYIPISFVEDDVVIYHSSCAIYDAELWLFALLTSKMHNLWVRAVGGSLETRIRYSATLCYNTFPFPKLTTAEKEELSEFAQEILNVRDENFDMTLGEMYNPESMPEELREAHHRLDLAVERIYRSEPFASDEERLEHLFNLYTKMTKNNGR